PASVGHHTRPAREGEKTHSAGKSQALPVCVQRREEKRKRRIRGPPLSREAGLVSLPLRQLGGLGRSAPIRVACPAITRVARYARRRRLLSPGPNSKVAGILPLSSVLVKAVRSSRAPQLAFECNRTNFASFFRGSHQYRTQ